ncbi:MAG: hypothetical protein JNK38_19465 [Acidobacteria bacterium]|nr:hypothetical protein [Acidobacteriota bacterium]
MYSEQFIAPTPASTGKTIAACVAGFVLPGMGHIVLGKYVRGALVGAVIIIMFALGFVMEGHLYKPESQDWLTWFFSFLDVGIGLPYFVCLANDWGFQVTEIQAAKVTYEYGNTFFCVAGALNMLAVMDAYDIGVGRKA